MFFTSTELRYYSLCKHIQNLFTLCCSFRRLITENLCLSAKYTTLIWAIISTFIQDSTAQSPSDALMMQKNELCIAAMGQQDTWNQYWEGTLLRTNGNIGTLTRQAFIPMLGYGITPKLTAIAMLPYIRTQASGGQMAGASGFQDIGLFVKYKWIDLANQPVSYQSFATLGWGAPASSYLADYMPFSLGMGCQEISIRSIHKIEYKDNIYTRLGFAYIHRFEATAERNFYYTDKAVYTEIMDVPSVVQAECSVGGWLFRHRLQAEFTTQLHRSLSGDDIRRQNAPQPTNKMEMLQMGGRLRYYAGSQKNLSLIFEHFGTLQGRNAGKSAIFNAGITWQWQLGKNNNTSNE